MDDGTCVEVGEGSAPYRSWRMSMILAAVLEAELKATVVAGSTDVGLWVTKMMRNISPAVFIGGAVEPGGP